MKWFKRRKEQPKQNDSTFVNVYDFETETVRRVPARELTPQMVEAKVHGIEGTVWVDAAELKPSDYRHPPFSEEMRDYLREIKASIDEFYPLSLEEWEDGFRRDLHPEREIAIWLHLAEVYKKLTTTRELSAEQRRDYFWVLVTCMNSPREHVFNVFMPQAISVEEARDVVEHYYGSAR